MTEKEEMEKSDDKENEKNKETLGQITRRHKLEHRNLQKQISAMMAKVKKSNKQTKKDVQGKTKIMEEELKLKQKNELLQLQSMEKEKEKNEDIQNTIELISVNSPSSAQLRKNLKKQKKKDLLLEKEIKLESDVKKSKLVPDQNIIEIDNIESQLKPLNLKIQQIAADGHCLFNSIACQLNLQNIKIPEPEMEVDQRLGEGNEEYWTLRALVAEYILLHKDEFEPFIEEPFQSYINKLRNTAVWGGQIELRALASIFKRKIVVFQATGPVIEVIDDQYVTKTKNLEDHDPLRICYHTQSFTLGGHYSSIVPRKQKKKTKKTN